MKTEFYLDDPGLPGTKSRICQDDGGLWYIFRANGSEHVYDTKLEMMDAWNTMVARSKGGN